MCSVTNTKCKTNFLSFLASKIRHYIYIYANTAIYEVILIQFSTINDSMSLHK